MTLKAIISGKIVPFFDSVVGLIMVIALLGFLWGAVRFIFVAGDDKTRSDARSLMVWGLVALFVMVSLWGITKLIRATFLGTT